MTAPALLPDVSEPLLAPHWEAAARGILAIPYCRSCGAAQWPPRINCLSCHAFDFVWREVEPVGTLFSYFVAHKPLHPAFESEVPYGAAAVTLAAGVRMLGRLIDIDLDDVRLEMPLHARFVERAPGVTLVYWGPER